MRPSALAPPGRCTLSAICVPHVSDGAVAEVTMVEEEVEVEVEEEEEEEVEVEVLLVLLAMEQELVEDEGEMEADEAADGEEQF
ncbi:hypothetical protein C8J57DRAFT_1503089 [Mycena rebaudengoi]|nr:hypothetical protein C8J57DRAFT_1503089 [Mycena rebaudengoi]